MDSSEYFNLLEYIKIYEKNKHTFESDFNSIVYTNILANNHNSNLSPNESIEFIGKNKSIYDKSILGKYFCVIKINFNNILIPDIEFTLFQKQKIILKNDKIQTEFPCLYEQIILWWKENVINTESFLQLVKLREQIAKIKKYILDNFTLDILPTKLYKYYYSNIDKFINIDEFANPKDLDTYRKFYDLVCKKYNIDFDKTNFKLDYLQNYFQNNMGLEQNFEVLFPIQSDSIIKFSNLKTTLEIKLYPRRYIDYYQPKFTVEITNLETNNRITNPTFNSLDSDRNLDKFYTNLIEYIGDFFSEMKNPN